MHAAFQVPSDDSYLPVVMLKAFDSVRRARLPPRAAMNPCTVERFVRYRAQVTFGKAHRFLELDVVVVFTPHAHEVRVRAVFVAQFDACTARNEHFPNVLEHE